MKDARFKWVHHGNERLFNVGIWADGSLWNPNSYPEDVVREAVQAAVVRRHERRSNAAKKAAETRVSRRRDKIYIAARCVRERQGIGARRHCYVCGRHLDDAVSIKRGIGPECWQEVLSQIEALVSHATSETGRHDNESSEGSGPLL